MQLAVYLTPEESRTFSAGKVIYNCLLADLYPEGKRPVKGSFENGWPVEIQERVLKNWTDYGFAAEDHRGDLLPEHVDEGFGGDDLSGVQKQRGQDGTLVAG